MVGPGLDGGHRHHQLSSPRDRHPGRFRSASTTTYRITGLTNGTTYRFSVEAQNGAGTSVASNSLAVTPGELSTGKRMAATPTGKGWFLAAPTGAVTAYGTAVTSGSMAGKALDAPVVAMAADPATGGYWEVATDGGVFSFGAPCYGSEGANSPAASVVGLAVTPTGADYTRGRRCGLRHHLRGLRLTETVGEHVTGRPQGTRRAVRRRGRPIPLGFGDHDARAQRRIGGHPMRATTDGTATWPRTTIAPSVALKTSEPLAELARTRRTLRIMGEGPKQVIHHPRSANRYSDRPPACRRAATGRQRRPGGTLVGRRRDQRAD